MPMSFEQSSNPLESRRKAQEEEYFRRQNAEAAARLKARRDLEGAGVKDPGLVKLLLQSGFDSDRVRALFLQPLIEMAWADGRVKDEERAKILKFVEDRGISEGSKAFATILTWLDGGSEEESFLQAKTLLEPIVTELKKSGHDESDWIVQSAEQIAAVTNSLFGFGETVSKDEKRLLQELIGRLKKS